MTKTIYTLLAVIFFSIGSVACGASSIEPVELSPEQATAEALVQRMEAASATAEASTTSTAFLEYAGDVMTAREQWDSKDISNYRWKYDHVNPASFGRQTFEITVENGQITQFKHTCVPDNCTLLKVENQADFTPEGVFDQLLQLAENRHAMSIIRFNDDLGLPQSIAANSDEAPYYIQWGTNEFEVIE